MGESNHVDDDYIDVASKGFKHRVMSIICLCKPQPSEVQTLNQPSSPAINRVSNQPNPKPDTQQPRTSESASVPNPSAPEDGPSSTSVPIIDPVVITEQSSPSSTTNSFKSINSFNSESNHLIRRNSIESLDSIINQAKYTLKKYEKEQGTIELIMKALHKNDFLSIRLNDRILNDLVAVMHPKTFAEYSYIIQEGQEGDNLYVSDSGNFEVQVNGKRLMSFGGGEVFGELALLIHELKHPISVQTLVESKVWFINKKEFTQIMYKNQVNTKLQNIYLLTNAFPQLEEIPEKDKLSLKIKRNFVLYKDIVCQNGGSSDFIYIIIAGEVSVHYCKENREVPKIISTNTKWNYFSKTDPLSTNHRIIANYPGVEFLQVNRSVLSQMIRDSYKKHDENNKAKKEAMRSMERRMPQMYMVSFNLENNFNLSQTDYECSQDVKEYSMPMKHMTKNEFIDHSIRFKDLQILGTLGVGGFARVELVQNVRDKSKIYALKCLKKIKIVENNHQSKVYEEKNAMMKCNSPFLCKLFNTYKDEKYLYFLMEPLLGGDLFTYIRKKRYLNMDSALFVTACVVEGLSHLHSLNIIFRDLKPENLMIDYKGYIKIVDFGDAKCLSSNSEKINELCGTTEYMAPEIILNQKYDRAVDYWSLGVLIYEILAGNSPFKHKIRDIVYENILKGINNVTFDPKIMNSAKIVIQKLCQRIPEKRLGYGTSGIKEIKNERWYNKFNWKKLEDRTMKTPLTKIIKNNMDLSNVLPFVQHKIPVDENSGFDRDF